MDDDHLRVCDLPLSKLKIKKPVSSFNLSQVTKTKQKYPKNCYQKNSFYLFTIFLITTWTVIKLD